MVDYYAQVRQNLQAAALRKQAERQEEARKQRSAKFGLIGLLVVVFTLVALFGDHLT